MNLGKRNWYFVRSLDWRLSKIRYFQFSASNFRPKQKKYCFIFVSTWSSCTKYNIKDFAEWSFWCKSLSNHKLELNNSKAREQIGNVKEKYLSQFIYISNTREKRSPVTNRIKKMSAKGSDIKDFYQFL